MATVSDRKILTSIFNPFLPLGENVCDEHELDELNSRNTEAGHDEDTADGRIAKDMELRGVKYAEEGDITKSLEFLTSAIEAVPNRASGYNNRAQALRLKGDIAGAERDLERAIQLSGGRGRVASQAYCQRGVIRQLRGEIQLAFDDYEAATKLGNDFARTLSVQLNPYAALCNRMLEQVMTKLQNGCPLP